MRHFYIFNINKELVNLTKINPSTLFNTFNDLSRVSDSDLINAINIYDSITKPINKSVISKKIFENYIADTNYSKYMYTHTYNNYFDQENSKLTINNTYIKLDTTSINSIFFNFLKKFNYLFVCDFDNNDYFWLESIA